jgi:hypothetical protein
MRRTASSTNYFERLLSANRDCADNFESRNAEAAMADVGDGAGLSGMASGEGRPSPAETATRGVRMLERLIAGSTLAEVAAREGLSPRRARELMAEAVAQRGYDP